MFYSWYDCIDSCFDYAMARNEEDEIKTASGCQNYEEGNPECLEEDEYCPSATAGDYSPSCPWNAPGCSISMFI